MVNGPGCQFPPWDMGSIPAYSFLDVIPVFENFGVSIALRASAVSLLTKRRIRCTLTRDVFMRNLHAIYVARFYI